MRKTDAIIPDKEEYLDILVKTRTIIQETFKLINVMSPENFFMLWVKYKDDLAVDLETKDNPKAMTAFYQNYLFLELLEQSVDRRDQGETPMIHHMVFANDVPKLRKIWNEKKSRSH